MTVSYTLRFPDGLLAQLKAEHARLYPGRHEQSFNAWMIINLIKAAQIAQKEPPK